MSYICYICLQLSCTKYYDVLIKNEDEEHYLDITESHKTVDQQRKETVPSSTDVRLSVSSREFVVELY